MIVRRITAGAAGLALVGTAFAAAPAMAKTNTTTLTLDSGLVSSLSTNGVKASAVSPAKLKKTTLTLPAKLKGTTLSHKGGLKLDLAPAFVSMDTIIVNTKTGKASANVKSSLADLGTVADLLIFKGGKNKLKTDGTWKNANVSLTKDKVVAGQDPASAMNALIFGGKSVLKVGQKLGKASIVVKK